MGGMGVRDIGRYRGRKEKGKEYNFISIKNILKFKNVKLYISIMHLNLLIYLCVFSFTFFCLEKL